MINTNELRIGNWILIDNGDMPKYYYQVTAHDIEEIEGNGGDCFGIPLTPAIFEACGYSKDSIDKRYYNSSTNLGPLGFVQNGQYCMIGLPLSCNNIKYLHHLQNVVHALTGTELTVNLEKVKV